MILSALAALLTALGPLMRGGWDLWAQSLLHLAVVGGLTAWILSCVFVGYVPLPSRRSMAWVACLVGLSAASAWASAVPGLARPEWYVLLESLWIFPAMAAMTKDARGWVDRAIRAAAWGLMALAWYQHFQLGIDRPASSLVNQNVYAGAVLLLLPIALEGGDWLLALGLGWSLLWCRSVGAWLGLFAALALTQRRRSPAWFWVGAGGTAVCGVVLYARLATPEVLHRWWWWRAAAEMAAAHPWLGSGPGSFGILLPSYLPMEEGGLYSRYAHQHVLQTMAELGVPFALLWYGGIWRCLSRGGSYKRFGAIAALVHSLWDYTFSMPSNLWLFSYCAASSIPDSAQGVNVPSRHKLPIGLAFAGLGLAAGLRVWDVWSADRHRTQAASALESGSPTQAREALVIAARLVPDDPETPRLAAAVEGRQGRWLDAASQLEGSVRHNPYRLSSWTELSLAYRRLGRQDAAEQVLKEAARYRR